MSFSVNKYNKSYTEISTIIDEWIFNERDRKILKRRFLDGICFEPLAEEFELSTNHVKKIVSKYQKDLDKRLK